LDELSVKIKEHVTAVQDLAVLKSVKPGKKPVARKGRSAKTVEESWNKKKPSTNENTLIGKYQKAPKQTTIDLLKVNSKVKTKNQLKNPSTYTQDKSKTQPKERVVDTENVPKTMDKKTRMFTDDTRIANTAINLNNNKYACELYTDKSREAANQYYLQLVIDASTGLKNMGNSCWFNSVVQPFSYTKLMRNINEQFNNEFCYEEDVRSVLEVFDKVGKGDEVTCNLLDRALHDLYTISGLETNRQNNAHEFVTNTIQYFMEFYGQDSFIMVCLIQEFKLVTWVLL
jgi:hypothetical protein